MRLAEIDLSAMTELADTQTKLPPDLAVGLRKYRHGDSEYKLWGPDFIARQQYLAGGMLLPATAFQTELLGFGAKYFDRLNASALTDFICDDHGLLRGYVYRIGQAVDQIPNAFARINAERSIQTGWVLLNFGPSEMVALDGQLSLINFENPFCALQDSNIDEERISGCLNEAQNPFFVGMLEGYLATTNAMSDRATPAPAIGKVRFGDLGKVSPISRRWGTDRGKPIDRFYVDRFIRRHGSDIRGCVLEIGDDGYARAFNKGGVTKIDVLHPDPKANTSIVGSLTALPHIADNTFDCIILTQVLQLIFDLDLAIATCQRILRPGGVLLVTVPGISHVSRDQSDVWKDYERWCWSFSTLSVGRLCDRRFGSGRTVVEGHGNVLSSISFLEGLAVGDVSEAQLEHRDPDFDLIITARAVK